MGYILAAIGILCIGYYIASVIYAGLGVSFIWIWLLGGIVLIGLGGEIVYLKKQEIVWQIPVLLKGILGIVVLAGCILFLIGEAWIFSGMSQKGQPNLDYIVVLGCQVKGERPSRALKERLDTAVKYLEENPDTMVVLTGGQGPGEDITEAVCMQTYLLEAGIPEKRLILEEQSTTTVENLKFSKQWIDVEHASVGIVSNNFHICRSLGIARKQGYQNVCGIAAPSRTLLQPHYLVRECLALWKEKLMGNI